MTTERDPRRRSRSPETREWNERTSRRERDYDRDDRRRRRHKDRDDDGERRPDRHHRSSHRRRRSPTPTVAKTSPKNGASKRLAARPTAASMMDRVDGDDGAPRPAKLPHEARALSRTTDYEAFEPLFSHYSDLHDQIDIAALPGRELRDLWRAFVRRWNEGRLSEGWYDPEMFARVAGLHGEEGEGGEARRDRARVATARVGGGRRDEERKLAEMSGGKHGDAEEEDGDDGGSGGGSDSDDYGPAPPPPSGSAIIAGPRGSKSKTSSVRPGPGIPSLQDLSARRADEEESRASSRDELRLARRADRAEQRERLDDLAPRAAAGTRERQLEKRRAVNEKMRGFREGSAGATEEAGDAELMGGGDAVDEYRRELAAQQRKKTEREVRREEEARARAEELQKRLRLYHDREQRTVGALRELARQRFGG